MRLSFRSVLAWAAAAGLAGCSGSDTPDGGNPDAGQSTSIQFEAAASSGQEGQATVQIPVVLAQAFRGSTAVVDVVARGTAGGNGEDYNLVQTTVSIQPGQTRATVDLDVVSDGFDEPDETVELSLSNPRTSGGDTLTVGTNQGHVYTILAQNTSQFPTLSFFSMTSAHPESVSQATVTVALSRPALSPISINYGRTGGTATPTADYDPFPGGTLTFAPGTVTQNITFTLRDDALDEDDETVVITLSNPVGEVTLGGSTTHTAILTDDDPVPTLELAAAAQSVAETDSAPSVPVTLSAASGRTVTVPYAVTGGSATGGGVDYTLTAGSLTFPAGITTRSIPINIVQDSAIEGPENVVIALGAPSGAVLGANSTLDLTILDDDVQPTVAFAAATSSANENGVSAQLTVTLSNPYNASISVPYAVTGGTATSSADYILNGGTLVFAAGSTSRAITLNILDDGNDEDDETVLITLGTPTNATVGTPGAHTFTILDEDPPPVLNFASLSSFGGEATPNVTLTVRLAPVSDRTVQVNYAVTGGTATGGGTDYTLTAGTLSFPPRITQQTIRFTVTNDILDEENETIVVTLDSPVNANLGTIPTHTFTINDDDLTPTVSFGTATSSEPESVTAPAIPVTLSLPSGRNVSVTFAVTGGTATSGTDYSVSATTFTIPAGTFSANLPLTVVQDTSSEGAETIVFTLTAATNATLAAPTGHTFTIGNDDGVPTVQFDMPAGSGGENLTAASATVTLSNASAQTITVQYSATGGTATSASDYSGATGTITFSPGQTSRPLGFSVVNDSLDEADETVVFTLANPVNATVGTQASHTYTITDEDATPAVQFQLITSSATEGGGAISRGVALTATSGQTVTVDYAVTGGTATEGTDYTFAAGTLTFPPNVSTTQNVPLTAVQDSVDENDETVILTLSNPVNATLGSNQSHTVTLLDDDPLPVATFSAPTPSGTESTAFVTFTVNLAPASARTVTVGYSATGGTAANGTDYSLTAGTLTFQPGETSHTFQLTVNDDATVEPNETVVISLNIPAPATATLGIPSNHTYTILNDD